MNENLSKKTSTMSSTSTVFLLEDHCILITAISCLILSISFVIWNSRKKMDLKGRHVLIVGGSSGIGRSAANYAVQLGANVTIAARDLVKLERTAADINEKYSPHQRVCTLSMDVTAGKKAIEQAVKDVEERVGPVDMLICSAGTAICGRLEDMLEEDVLRLNNLNFLGSLWLTHILLPSMKARGEGSIVLVASQAALLGIYGYSAYGATKWAIRGLGESLMMETVGTGVSVTLSFPPDTDTPGFELEEASKPTETKIISGSGGLYSPEAVAQQLLIDAMKKRPYSSVGLEGWMLTTMGGLTSAGIFSTLIQALLMGPFRIVLMFYEFYFHYIIRKCRKEKNINKKAK